MKKNSYTERFIEVCGSNQPNEIARLLNISYQAAKNYLHGRLPDSKVLIIISEKTPYSLNWLLTGDGEKLAKEESRKDTLILSDQIRAFVRQTCLEVISEVLGNMENPPASNSKTVVLTSEKIKKEKVLDKSVVLSENEDK